VDLGELVISVRLANPKAVRALALAARTVAELADRMPYDPEVARSAKALRYALKNLKAAVE